MEGDMNGLPIAFGSQTAANLTDSSRGLDNMAWWEGKQKVREYLKEVNEKETVRLSL